MSIFGILLLGLTLRGSAGAGELASAGACPTDNTGARARVYRFLTSSTYAEEREKYGIPSVASPTIRVLTDVQDAAACQRFAAMVKPPVGKYPTATVYYEFGGFYFVPSVWVLPPDDLYITFTPLSVFRSDFSYVNSYGM